ncbi:hypothetical protein JCGZ_10364 [Jatropha curcas]|uniref:Uncharacterized protein n=1 Tax=Jatropha curcas TaxID=180498 RepID=A0A067KSX4_JATCU|nr:hypothetical protein JCGZ_10364 [Jatropha curcas]
MCPSLSSVPSSPTPLSGPVESSLASQSPAALDDTLVTPADTMTHPAGTPPGDMTLDRAADQPCRFDFRSFSFL